MLPSYADFKNNFPVKFEYYQDWSRMTHAETNVVLELDEHFENARVTWPDKTGGSKPIPPWAVRRVAIWSGFDLGKAKSFCMSKNHPNGNKSCSKNNRNGKGGLTCGYVHKCLLCLSPKHGVYERSNGTYSCDKLRDWDSELKVYSLRYGEIDEEQLKALARRPPRSAQPKVSLTQNSMSRGRASAKVSATNSFGALADDEDKDELKAQAAKESDKSSQSNMSPQGADTGKRSTAASSSTGAVVKTKKKAPKGQGSRKNQTVAQTDGKSCSKSPSHASIGDESSEQLLKKQTNSKTSSVPHLADVVTQPSDEVAKRQDGGKSSSTLPSTDAKSMPARERMAAELSKSKKQDVNAKEKKRSEEPATRSTPRTPPPPPPLPAATRSTPKTPPPPPPMSLAFATKQTLHETPRASGEVVDNVDASGVADETTKPIGKVASPTSTVCMHVASVGQTSPVDVLSKLSGDAHRHIATSGAAADDNGEDDDVQGASGLPATSTDVAMNKSPPTPPPAAPGLPPPGSAVETGRGMTSEACTEGAEEGDSGDNSQHGGRAHTSDDSDSSHAPAAASSGALPRELQAASGSGGANDEWVDRQSVSSTLSTVTRYAKEGGAAAEQELKFRGKRGIELEGDMRAFALAGDLKQCLKEKKLFRLLKEYVPLVERKNRANHAGGGAGGSAATSKQHAEEFALEDASWPSDRTIPQMHQGGTKLEKCLLELLCLRIMFKPNIKHSSDISCLAWTLWNVRVQSVHRLKDGVWVVAFRTPEDVSKVHSDQSKALEDAVQSIQPYTAYPTNRRSTVKFFNFNLKKFALEDLQQKMEEYGEVLNVHPVAYHDDMKEKVMRGWVEFRNSSSADRLLQDIEEDRYPYYILKQTYTVVRFAETMVNITQDWPVETNANSSAAPAAAEAEPPYTRPKREACLLHTQMSASEGIAGSAAELDRAIPGLGEVATKAKVLDLPIVQKAIVARVNPVAREVVKEHEAEGTLPGLANLGNTCFANSVLQCLLNTPGRFPEECVAFSQSGESAQSKEAAVGRAFQSLAREYGSKVDVALERLRNMKDAIAAIYPQFAGDQQQDADEFLGHVLAGLKEGFGALFGGLSDDRPGPSADVIRAIFGITSFTRRKCHCCSGVFEVARETDNVMRVPLLSRASTCEPALREQEEATPITLQDLLDASRQPEDIEGYDCDACRAQSDKRGEARTSSTITRVIAKTRDVVVVVLYRFADAYDSTGTFKPKKVNRQVACPTELKLESKSYRLFGVVSHLGESLSEGHYVATVRSRRDDAWYECNDERVTPLNLKALNHGGSVTAVSPGAVPYILFYHRNATAEGNAGQTPQDLGADTDANLRTSSAAPAAAPAAASPGVAVAASPFASAAAEAEPPYTRPERQTSPPFAQIWLSKGIEGLAAELDHAIPGLGEVATKAKVLDFLTSPDYVKKVLAWIATHEIAELKELAEDGDKVTGFAHMKEKPSKRWLRELWAAVADAGDNGR